MSEGNSTHCLLFVLFLYTKKIVSKTGRNLGHGFAVLKWLMGFQPAWHYDFIPKISKWYLIISNDILLKKCVRQFYKNCVFYINRERDFLQERDSLLQQQAEKDQQYNSLVKSLKDRVSFLLAEKVQQYNSLVKSLKDRVSFLLVEKDQQYTSLVKSLKDRVSFTQAEMLRYGKNNYDYSSSGLNLITATCDILDFHYAEVSKSGKNVQPHTDNFTNNCHMLYSWFPPHRNKWI